MGVDPLTPPLLELRDLACAPAGRAEPLVGGVSLVLAAGELAFLLGGNGAGKTTLFRTVAGLLPRRGGSVLVDGRDATGHDPRRVALVLDDPASQFVTATLRRELEFSVECTGRSGTQVTAPAETALDEHGLLPLAERDPLTLSAGEQQGGLVAAALLGGPRVLLLDDPFLYVDVDHALRALDALRARVRSGSLGGVILSGHDADLAAECDRVGVLEGGRLRAWGRPAEVLSGALPAPIASPLGARVDRVLERLGMGSPVDDIRPEAAARRVARAARR